MKKYLKALLPPFILLFAMTIWPISESNETYAQLVVADAGTEAAVQAGVDIQADMAITLTEMETQSKVIAELQKATGYIQDAKMVYQFGQLLANLICTYSTLKFMIRQHSGLLQACNFSAQYQLAFLNVQGAIDIVNMVVKGGLKMDQGIRVQNMAQAINLFYQGHSKLLTLTNSMGVYTTRNNLRNDNTASLRATRSVYLY